jgi:hypothetical protein
MNAPRASVMAWSWSWWRAGRSSPPSHQLFARRARRRALHWNAARHWRADAERRPAISHVHVASCWVLHKIVIPLQVVQPAVADATSSCPGEQVTSVTPDLLSSTR